MGTTKSKDPYPPAQSEPKLHCHPDPELAEGKDLMPPQLRPRPTPTYAFFFFFLAFFLGAAFFGCGRVTFFFAAFPGRFDFFTWP
jgi:hypothetical protein